MVYFQVISGTKQAVAELSQTLDKLEFSFELTFQFHLG